MKPEKKIGEKSKGRIPWNKGKTGIYSDETLKKIREANLKRYANGEKFGFQKGHKRLKLTNKGDFKKGDIPWNKGKTIIYENSKERNEKIRKGMNGNKNALGKKHSNDANRKKSERQRGEKSHFWIDGRTPENKRVRRSVEMKLWREAVFTRDNFICQKCKISGRHLHPHHIFNFSSHIDRRFDISNGITLCKECHERFHKIYGRFNNTLEQLEEFLQK